jgi:hypothetical protein
VNEPAPTALATVQPASVFRLPLPALRRPFTAIRRQALAFRKAYEGVLVERTGGVTPWQAKVLRTAAKAYCAALRVDRILARAGEPGVVGTTGLSHEQFQGYLDRSVRYERECDAALKSLGLDRTESDRFVDAYTAAMRTVPAPTRPEPPPPAADLRQNALEPPISAAADPQAAQPGPVLDANPGRPAEDAPP